MYKVLFVCLGNICRSPLAEGIFNSLLKEKKITQQIFCDSAGTANYHVGENPDPRTIEVANQHGIRLNHKGRQFSVEDFDNFDLIVTMDESIYKNVLLLSRNNADSKKAVLMRKYDHRPNGGNVPDPWYGNMQDFGACYTLLSECCTGLLDVVIKENKL